MPKNICNLFPGITHKERVKRGHRASVRLSSRPTCIEFFTAAYDELVAYEEIAEDYIGHGSPHPPPGTKLTIDVLYRDGERFGLSTSVWCICNHCGGNPVTGDQVRGCDLQNLLVTIDRNMIWYHSEDDMLAHIHTAVKRRTFISKVIDYIYPHSQADRDDAMRNQHRLIEVANQLALERLQRRAIIDARRQPPRDLVEIDDQANVPASIIAVDMAINQIVAQPNDVADAAPPADAIPVVVPDQWIYAPVDGAWRDRE